MWEKIKAFAIANPKTAAFSIFLDMFFIGSWWVNGFMMTLIVVGVVGMVVVTAMAFTKYLGD